MVVELERGVAPIKGLSMEGTFSCSTLFKEGMAWGGPAGSTDARRVDEDFVGVALLGVLVRSE